MIKRYDMTVITLYTHIVTETSERDQEIFATRPSLPVALSTAGLPVCKETGVVALERLPQQRHRQADIHLLLTGKIAALAIKRPEREVVCEAMNAAILTRHDGLVVAHRHHTLHVRVRQLSEKQCAE